MQQAIARRRPAVEYNEPLTPYERFMLRVVQSGIGITMASMVVFFRQPLYQAAASILS